MLAIDLNIGDVVLEDGRNVDLVTLDMVFELRDHTGLKSPGRGGGGLEMCVYVCVFAVVYRGRPRD